MSSAQPTNSNGASESRSRASKLLISQLSVMMFLQYWALGIWWVTVVTYIGANTGEEGTGIFSPSYVGYSGFAGAIGSLFAPAIFGWIADRFFPADRLLMLLHALAGLALWWMHESSSQLTFSIALVLYFQFYVPTVTLTNTIALRQLVDVDREFFLVRLFGTFAWISSGLFLGIFCKWFFGESIEASRLPIMIGAISHIVMAVYCFALPSTPYGAALERDFTGGSSLLRNRAFMVFLAVSFLACIPSQAYNFANLFLNEMGYERAAARLTVGQGSELICMILAPMLLIRYGLKWVFLVGILSWSLRYILLSLGSAGGPETSYAWLVFVAIAIHGPSYTFVYVTGQLYIDRLVSPARRGAAQGFHTVATGGLGHLAGAYLVGRAQAVLLTPAGVSPPPYRWGDFWMLPAGVGFIAAAIFLFAFRNGGGGKQEVVELHASDAPPSPLDALTEPPHK
jgi:nucleoside transporter